MEFGLNNEGTKEQRLTLMRESGNHPHRERKTPERVFPCAPDGPAVRPYLGGAENLCLSVVERN
jgi:hypothetical protein